MSDAPHIPEPMVYLAPDFRQVGINALLANSAAAGGVATTEQLNAAVAELQTQLDALAARVSALEAVRTTP